MSDNKVLENQETTDDETEEQSPLDEFGPVVKRKKVKQIPKSGIGARTVELLREAKHKDARIISIITAEFPDSRFQQTHVAYYRSVLKTHGELYPQIKSDS